MKKKYLPFETKLEYEYPGLRLLFAVEGGAYFFAKKKDKFFIISDFGTLAEFVEKDEFDKLKKEYEFTNKDECRRFINELINSTKKEQININLPIEIL